MELQQTELTLAEEPTMIEIIKRNVNSNHGELLLTAEKISLAEEIKILIRKLWN
jgi:hypothetical protein